MSMRFLFVTSGPAAPTTRFRVLPYLTFLEAAGHRCDVAHSFPEKYEYFRWLGWRLSQLLKRTVRHWHAFLAARRKYDAIFIEREVFDDDTWDLETLFRRATNRLIIDVDDAIFLRHPVKFDKIIALADTVIAGNRLLGEYVAEHTAFLAKPPLIEIIPTSIRLADYPIVPRSSRSDKKVVVGWIGTSYNTAYLREIGTAIRDVAKQCDFKLLIVSGNPDHLPHEQLDGVDWEFRKWRADREVADVQEMDIGLMPLPIDDPWARYKCGLKLLQYLAAGAAGIASPVGVNEEILSDRSAGRLARTPEEWRDCLLELIESPELRLACGRVGRDIVERRFTIEGHWRAFERVLVGQQFAPNFESSVRKD